MSPNTLGHESTVTLTFTKQGDDTLMTLVHADLPGHELARGHQNGRSFFLGTFCEQFGQGLTQEVQVGRRAPAASKQPR